MNNFNRYLYFLLVCYAICSEIRAQGYNWRPFPPKVVQSFHMPLITEEDIETAFCEANLVIEQDKAQEINLYIEGRFVDRNVKTTRSVFHNRAQTLPITPHLGDKQAPFDKASDCLIKQHHLDSLQVAYGLPHLPLNSPFAAEARRTCTSGNFPIQCDQNTPYRTINGLCNNFANPRWGSALACFNRLLPSAYEGEAGFRTSVEGGPLPEPRTLSLNIHFHVNRPTTSVNHMYMFFGQFLDHDISLTAVTTTVDNELIDCCPSRLDSHPMCAEIAIANNDPFYSEFGVTCLNFIRSQICPYCTLGTRNQINQITAFIDASHIYGNEENVTNGLRTNDGTGRLIVQRTRVGDLLPQSREPANDQCSIPDQNQICFEAGDPRANQHPNLASLHTIFVREHNRIVRILRELNPWWDEERSFQETRKILGAEMQVITYNEYLPITLGKDRMSYFGLRRSRQRTTYDPDLDPMLYTDFSTAAFRFGHTLINSEIAEVPTRAGHSGHLLRNVFFNPFGLYESEVDVTTLGSTVSPSQSFDRHLVPDVTNFLYRVPGNETGFDLASFNIQRGRDHGLPGYTDYVQFCSQGEVQIRSFDDLSEYELMTQDTVNVLRRNYRNVNDIDLWTGGVSEIFRNGAVVGPTFTCIIGLQFNRLKYGDRFYFEHDGQAGSFTSAQVRELKKVTLSRIICDNTRITQINRNAMLLDSQRNPMMPCQDLPFMDLRAWQE